MALIETSRKWKIQPNPYERTHTHTHMYISVYIHIQRMSKNVYTVYEMSFMYYFLKLH